jgi:hypothetical protein
LSRGVSPPLRHSVEALCHRHIADEITACLVIVLLQRQRFIEHDPAKLSMRRPEDVNAGASWMAENGRWRKGEGG